MSRLRDGIYAILCLERLAPVLPEDPFEERALLEAYARAAADAGVVALQLRDKQSPAHSLALSATYQALVEAVAGRCPVVMNDHLVAVTPLAQRHAVGLHLGQDDASPRTARATLGERALIGLSTHDLDQLEVGRRQPVDYLGFGPIRATDSKVGAGAALGFAALQRAAATTAKPVVAIGGLTIDDVEAVRAAGAHAMAVIGAWLGPADAPFDPRGAGVAASLLAATWAASAPETP